MYEPRLVVLWDICDRNESILCLLSPFVMHVPISISMHAEHETGAFSESLTCSLTTQVSSIASTSMLYDV